MNRITFVIGGLGGGGAENVCVTLANEFSMRGISVDLIVLNLKSDRRSTSLLPEVNLIDLKCKGVRTSALSLLRYLWREKPEKILSFNRQISVMLVVLRSLFFLSFFLISRNIIFLSVAESKKKGFWHGFLIKGLIKYFYPKSDLFIAQAEEMKKDIIEYLYVPEKRVAVINNPISTTISSMNESDIVNANRSRNYILCVGRLEAQKRFDLAIKSFAKIKTDLPGLRLKILGSGSQELYLRNMAVELGIGNDVDFEGYCYDTVQYFLNAELTLMTSEFEGFPNVLLESIALGTKIVSVDCPSGPSEIVSTNNGCLVLKDDEESIKHAVLTACQLDLSPEIIRKTSLKFSSKNITDKYLAILGDL